MLTFPEDFFKDETRSDFYVPEMMKRAWAAHLKILDELQTLFKKYDLFYFADFGTLLGAVRHGGYIPWDDDLDISMPRADFMKFLEHADELPKELRVLSAYNSDTFVNFHAVATNNTADMLAWDQSRFDSFYGCPFICYIDIFPMDYVPRDPEKKKLRENLYSFAYKTVYDCIEVENSSFAGRLITLEELQTSREKTCGPVQALLDQTQQLQGFLERFYGKGHCLDTSKPLRNQLCLAAELIASSVEEKDADRVDYAPHMAYLKPDISKHKDWVKETVEMPFEVTKIAVPSDYASVLTARFGPNYMTPQHQRSTHEYPYYRTQIEVLVGGEIGETCAEDAVRAPILEAVDTLKEAHEILKGQLEQMDAAEGQGNQVGDAAEGQGTSQATPKVESVIDQSRGLLADLQEGAVGIGEAIEQIREDSGAVALLTEYCEGIYELYRDIDSSFARKEKERGLKEMLDKVSHLVVKEIHPAIPEAWEKKLRIPGGGSKKLMLYGLSAIELVNHGRKSIDKLRSSLEIFESVAADTCVMLCVSAGVRGFFEQCELVVAGDFGEILDEFENDGYGILETGENLAAAVSLADAYYGDPCPLMDLCKKAGIPIMVQNYEL